MPGLEARGADPAGMASIPIESVAIPDGHREPEDDQVGGLAESVRYLGLLHPITVRPADGRGYRLVAGRGRLEACRSLGETHIRAFVRAFDDDEAEAASIAENLFRAGLRGHDFDRAIARWKALYEAAHPPRRPLERADPGGPGPAPRFDQHAAATTGYSSRMVREAARRGEAFDDEDRGILECRGVGPKAARPLASMPDRAGRKAAIAALARQATPDVPSAIAEATVGPGPGPIEEGLSDPEWLDTLPVRPKLADRALFDVEALLYRRSRAALSAFRKAMAPLLQAGKAGLFEADLRRVVEAKHPRDWLLCGTCGGQGGLSGPCRDCRGGYRVR